MTRVVTASRWRTLIVGLGRIGQAYDYDLPETGHVTTHARAFSLDPHFVLIGGVDPDEGARARFTTRFGAPAFATIGEAARSDPDVVVVATPTALHLSSVEAVLEACAPRVVVCEKPLAFTVAEASRLLDACGSQGCSVYVNYMRRTDVTTAELRARLADGRIGTPLRGVAWYSKGLYNSASHFVNLLEDLLGESPRVVQANAGRITPNGDPEPDFALQFARGTIEFRALRAEDYFHNSMELFSPSGRLRYEQAGATVDWIPARSDQPGGLSSVPERLRGDFARIQAHFTACLAQSMAGLPSQACTGTQALATLRLLERIQPFPTPVLT